MPATGAEGGQLRRAQRAVAVAFLLFGLGAGVWLVHIPVVTARLGLSPALLGIGLLGGGVVALAMQPLAGAVVARLGSRRVTAAMLPLALASFPLPVLAPSVPLFLAALVWIGVAVSAFNVALNTQAAEVQALRGRPVMSMFHGFFSLGGLIAAGLGGAVIGLGLEDGRGALGLATLSLAIGLVTARGLLPGQGAAGGPRGPRFALPGRALVGLALLAFLCNAVEGAVTNWSALYLATVKGATASRAALAIGGYSLAMAAGRFAGGAVVARLGERRVVAGGGVLVAAGMALALAAPTPVTSAAGFLVVGLGAANALPVLIGAASRVPGIPPAAGVAGAISGATAGFLIGPPLIGSIAQAFGLTTALAAAAAAGIAVAAIASLRPWPGREGA
jgi:MFS family permease